MCRELSSGLLRALLVRLLFSLLRIDTDVDGAGRRTSCWESAPCISFINGYGTVWAVRFLGAAFCFVRIQLLVYQTARLR